MNSENKLFKVGEKLKCMTHAERKDGGSSIKPGDIVTVIQEYTFTFEGNGCQEITVQCGDCLPIACDVEPGRFERV